jgi:hypothetical protein
MWITAAMAGLLVTGLANADKPEQPVKVSKSKKILVDFFDRAEVADPFQVKDLKIYPLIRVASKDVDEADYLVTDKAMKKKVIEVKEHNGGEVQTLKLAKSKSKRPVFMTGGEILSGAKQDRILSQDVMLPQGNGSYLVAVYCVEQGRWVMKSNAFESQGAMGTGKLRKTVAKKGGQSSVWSEVDAKSSAMGVSSSTDAMMANYDSPKNKKKIKKIKKELKDYMNGFKAVQEVIGIVATVDGEIVSLDAFRNEDLFLEFWPKLSKALALDAIDPSFKEGEVTKEDVELFIESLEEAEVKKIKNPGIGKEVSIEGVWAEGTAHLYNKGVNHVNLFPDYAKYKMRVFGEGGSGPAISGPQDNPDPQPQAQPQPQPQPQPYFAPNAPPKKKKKKGKGSWKKMK